MKTLEEYEKQIHTGKKHGIVGAVQIGQALLAINKDNLWVISGAQTFEKYVEGEHGFSRSTAFNLMGVANQFGDRILAGDVCDVTRLIRLLPLTTDANREELFEMACHVPSSSAFDANIRNLKGKIAPDECDHPDGFAPVPYEVCPHCGLRRKVEVKR